MEPQEGEDDYNQSVYSLISAFCRHLSSDINNVDAAAIELHQRSLRRIAYTHLLNHTPRTTEGDHLASEDVPLALFTVLASKKLSNNQWTYSEYAKACAFLEKIEKKFPYESVPSWVWNMGRMLIALELNRPQPSTSSTQDSTWSTALRCMDGLSYIPKAFQLRSSKFLSHELNDGLSPIEFFWTHFKSQLPKLQLPMRIDTLCSTRSHRKAIEQNDPAKVLPRSTSQGDEGFSSPTDVVTRRKPLNWSLVPTSPKKRYLEWESFSIRPEDQYSKITRTTYCDIQFSPCGLVKVPFPEAMECIKALLLGASSHIFKEIDGDFSMTPGFYTDNTPPNLMYMYCKTFRKGGFLLSKLVRLTEDYISLTSASMSVVVKNFMLDYQAFINSIPMSNTLLKLYLAIIPFINQLEYLAELLEGNTGGWQLLDKLYDDTHQMVDEKLSCLAAALFMDCFTTYLTFIEKWIFDGQWHPELFFEKHIPTEDICDRYTWSRCYTFNVQNAPHCLPSADIYECGKLVHLVKSQRHLTDENSLLMDCRPKLQPITDINEFLVMKNLCHYYSHTGDELRLEAIQKCQVVDEINLSSVAREKAEADSFKYDVAKAVVQETKLYEKLNQIIELKRQLAIFEEHRNSKELKRSLLELLEEDRLTYHEIEKMITSLPYREELVERYFMNEERCARRSILNYWKEKRRNLNTERTQYFGMVYNSRCSPSVDTDLDNSHSTYEATSNKHPTSSTPLDKHSVDQLCPIPNRLGPKLEEDECLVWESSGSYISCREETITSPVTCKIPSDMDGITHNEVEDSEHYETINTIGETADNVTEHKSNDGTSELIENVVGSSTQPNESPAEIQRDVIESFVERISTTYSLNVHQDILKPFDYIKNYHSRDGYTRNPGYDLPATGKTLNQEMPSTHFRKSRLNFLVANSIEYPLQAQIRVIKNLAVHKLFIENDLIVHFKRLRDVFLKNNGSGAQIFANMLSKHIEQDDPQAFSVHHKLHNILNSAYPMESKFLALKPDYIPQALDSSDPHVFSFLRLGYKNYWPLNLILTDMALVLYNEVFDFLTSIDFTLVYLQQVFQFLRAKILEFRGENYKKIQLQRHIMLTFVTSLKSYTGSMVTLCWNQMYSELPTVQDPEQLYRIHVRFLKNLHSTLLLHKTTERIQECLAKALHYVLVYCQTIFHAEWELAANGECINSKYKKLSHTYANFMEMVGGCEKLVNYFNTEHGHVHLKVLSQFMF